METRHLRLSAPAKKLENEYVMAMDVPPKLQMLEILETQPYFLESQHESTFATGILGDVPHALKLQIYRDYSEIYLGLHVRITSKPGQLVHLASAKGVFVFTGEDLSVGKEKKKEVPRGIPTTEVSPKEVGGQKNIFCDEVPAEMEEEGSAEPPKFEDEVPRSLFQFRITSSSSSGMSDSSSEPIASTSTTLVIGGGNHIEFEGTRRYRPNEELPPGVELRNCGGFQVMIIREEGKLPEETHDSSFPNQSGENLGKFVTCHFAKSRIGSSTLPERDDPTSEEFEFFQAKCLWPSLPSTLHVVLKISKLVYSAIIDEEEEYPQSHPRGLVDSRPFLFSDEFSDVQIKVRDEVIAAHKIVLASRSRYFRAMFATGMREAVEGVVHLEEEDPTLMKILLRFMYTGEMSLLQLEDNITELWALADKYDVEDLTRRIELHLLQHLSVDNVLEMLDLSLAVAKRGKLAKKAKQLLMWNKEVITGDRNTFKELARKHPDLIFDLLKL